MGPNSSKTPNGSKKESFLLIKENHSSYNGIKTETTNSKNSISGGSLTSKDEEEALNNNYATQSHQDKDVKLPTVFEWKEGGNTVYVTGTFCGWAQFFIMSKMPNGSFHLTLDLPRGFHQYKFKVDDVWKYTSLYPTFNDNNNTNNYIDTTNWEIPIKETKEPKSKNSKLPSKPSKDVYANYYPKKEELNTCCPLAPIQYANIMNVANNTQQQCVGDNDMMGNCEQFILSDNNCYKALTVPTHVNL